MYRCFLLLVLAFAVASSYTEAKNGFHKTLDLDAPIWRRNVEPGTVYPLQSTQGQAKRHDLRRGGAVIELEDEAGVLNGLDTILSLTLYVAPFIP